MTDLSAKIKAQMAEYEQGDPLAHFVAAVESVLENHSEFPEGWCVSCGRDYPCVTVRDVAVAFRVVQPEAET